MTDQASPVPSMTHIFVSYSRADSETVDFIVGRLKRDGFDIWIDREAIKVGERWGGEIVKAVHNAYAVLLMLSPSAVASRYVLDEVYLAYNANKDFIPILLAPVEISGDLSLPLVRPQSIKYYSDPEATYAELVKVLHSRKPEPTPKTHGVELVIPGLNRATFDPEKQEQLLELIADFTRSPRSNLQITKPIDVNGHVLVNMPADAAYRLKTAALNRDLRLIDYGIDGLRLTGDRHFVLLKTGRMVPLKSGKLGGRWFIVSSALVIALLIALIFASSVAAPIPPVTNTPIATTTFAPTPSYTPTSTPERTPTPQCPIIVNVVTHDNCSMGPGPEDKYEVVSAINIGTRVPLIGQGSTPGWFIVLNPRYTNVPCWMRESSLQIGPGSNGCALPVFTPPASLTPTPEAYTIAVPVDGNVAKSKILENGINYLLRASGTFTDGTFIADAEYTSINNFPADTCYAGVIYIDQGLGIVDPANPGNKLNHWGPYNNNNVYVYQIEGKGEPVTFGYYDCYSLDNSGSLTIEISILR